MAHDTGFLSIPVALFFGIAFIVLFFTFGDGDGNAYLAFHHVVFPVQRQRDDGVAFLLGGVMEFGYLFAG